MITMAFDPIFGQMLGLRNQDLTLRKKSSIPAPKVKSGVIPPPTVTSTGAPYIPGLPNYNASYAADSPNNPWDALVKANFNTKTSSKSAIPGNTDPWIDPYAGFDPETMANREFDPQFALINRMEGQATKRYTAAGADIGGAWDLLAKDVKGREKGIKADTTASGKSTAKSWGNVSSAATKALDAAKAELIKNATASGTMETIAPQLAAIAAQRADLLTQTGSYGANADAFNTQMGQNALQANRDTADEAKWGGIGARADFAGRLQGALDELGNKRLDITGQRGAAVNKYGMDIAGGRESSREAWNTLQTQRAAQQIDIARQQASAAAAAAKANTPKPIDITKLTPSEYLAYVAGGLYNQPGEGRGIGSRAANAAAAIQDTFIHAPKSGYKNAREFVDAVISRNPKSKGAGGDARQLEQLAQDYYKKIAGSLDKPYGG